MLRAEPSLMQSGLGAGIRFPAGDLPVPEQRRPAPTRLGAPAKRELSIVIGAGCGFQRLAVTPGCEGHARPWAEHERRYCATPLLGAALEHELRWGQERHERPAGAQGSQQERDSSAMRRYGARLVLCGGVGFS